MARGGWQASRSTSRPPGLHPDLQVYIQSLLIRAVLIPDLLVSSLEALREWSAPSRVLGSLLPARPDGGYTSCAFPDSFPLPAGNLDSAFIPGVQDFDKKLTEADAYLWILVDQSELRDDKFQNWKDNEQKKKIRETTKSRAESIKQFIVLLQMATGPINL
ncbi:Oxysterol-binding protein-related protein 9 [Fukomys damarensis]|uniref:Oxysterol-binding protein-related protein 9 n=1 Tax=Fukomys damarensis TaxID=885580 RepID=A0A091DCW3_FUKDA|nr:Oxysterol-binding protein-related protein 9 [Fukomys damarensis]